MSVLRTPIIGVRHVCAPRGFVPSSGRPKLIDERALLGRVHAGRQLLFTRNTDLNEIDDMLAHGRIRAIRQGNWRMEEAPKQFRYGIAHEYGVITVVMKREFYSTEKAGSRLENIWLRGLEVGGKRLEGKWGNTGLFGETISPDEADEMLGELAEAAMFNRDIPAKAYTRTSPDLLDPAPGHTAVINLQHCYGGNLPQLEVDHDIPLEMVERILVPEHLAAEVAARLTDKSDEIRDLFVIVEGTGKTEQDFLAGKDKLIRRSREGRGKYRPRFGENSFHQFEVAYYQLTVDGQPLSYLDKAFAIAKSFGFNPVTARHGWIDIYPSAEGIRRNGHEDWCLFIQPKADQVLEVLEIVLHTIENMGITLKLPSDLTAIWRRGRTFGDPGSPKIKLYLNQEMLAQVTRAIDEELAKAGLQGDTLGPSFTRAFGDRGLFYKKEYFHPIRMSDDRGVIADQLGNRSTMDEKSRAIAAAGYIGENFYMKSTDQDPLLATADSGEPVPVDDTPTEIIPPEIIARQQAKARLRDMVRALDANHLGRDDLLEMNAVLLELQRQRTYPLDDEIYRLLYKVAMELSQKIMASIA